MVTRVHGGWPVSIHKDAQHPCCKVLLGLLASIPRQPLKACPKLFPTSCWLGCFHTAVVCHVELTARAAPQAEAAAGSCTHGVHCPCPISSALSFVGTCHSLLHPSVLGGGMYSQCILPKARGWVVQRFSQFEVGHFIALGRRAGHRGLGHVARAGLGVRESKWDT